MEKIKVYEMKVKLFLFRDLKKQELSYELSKLISSYLSQNNEMDKLHKSKGYKPYCFDSLYPLEKVVYKKENVYCFRIRSIDEEFVNYMLDGFDDFKNNTFKNLTIEARLINRRQIDKLYSITPIVIKNDFGYWKGNISLEDFESRIIGNIEKKYKYFIQDDIEFDKFFCNLNLLNDKPICIRYKDIKLLGDKIEINVNLDEKSQELAYLALGVTFSEMNYSGMGFLGYKYL